MDFDMLMGSSDYGDHRPRFHLTTGTLTLDGLERRRPTGTRDRGGRWDRRDLPPLPAGRPREVVAVEPEASLRRLATAAAARGPVPVRVIDGVPEQLPAEGSAFDAAVTCNTLC
jgi:hypothetical protein